MLPDPCRDDGLAARQAVDLLDDVVRLNEGAVAIVSDRVDGGGGDPFGGDGLDPHTGEQSLRVVASRV
jgi:hypothetical protein